MGRSGKIIVGCMIGLLLLMLFTEPAHLPPALLAAPFVLIFAVIVLGLVSILRWQGVGAAKSTRLGLIGASLPMLILVLQAFGQLTLRDLLTILALFAITYFYLSRITKPSGG